MDIIIIVSNEVDRKWFLKGSKYVGTFKEKYVVCAGCTSMLFAFYTVTVDGVDYDIPEEYIIEDDGYTEVDARYPLKAWQDRTDKPWPTDEPIHDYDKAYMEYMGVDLTADPFVQRSITREPDDPGKNDITTEDS
jgi:hypothetical protein